MQGIYKIINRLNGKAYGGSSADIERRWNKHCRMLRNKKHHCAYLQSAWNLYGEDVFEFRVLEVIEDADERLVAEQKWLDEHHANKACYNSAITAGPRGPISEETRRRQRAAKAGQLHPMWGTHLTEEQRRVLSVSLMGNQRALGSKRTEEWRRAMSERMLGNQHLLGHRHTDATKRKQSRAHKRQWARRRAMAGLSLPVLIPNPARPMLLYGGYRK